MIRSEISPAQGIIEHIEAGKIRPSRSPLRKIDLGNNHEVDELASSIMEKGLLFPILVRPIDNSKEDGSYFEVVAGNRRFAACKKLKIKKIPCCVSEFDDKLAYEVSLVENLQRRTLDPLEEARAFKKYVDEFGYGSVSELSKKIGKSHSYVSRRIGLLRLPSAVQEQLLVRGAQVGLAQELLPLADREDTTGALSELIVKKNLTRRSDVRQLVIQARKSLLLEERDRLKLDRSDILSPNYFSSRELRQRSVDRAFNKYIATLKVCMMRMDDVLDSIDEDDEWAVRELLMQYRKLVHRHIDALIKLKTRTQKLLESPSSPL
jgi:ParB family transcriptional regulator, chromosome partitioning protein